MAIGTTPSPGDTTPVAPGTGKITDPWQGSVSPAQYFLNNGGNPAMLQNFLYWMSSAPADLAKQMAGNPAQAFQMYTQGTGYDPSSKGLTQNSQGQYVNSQGAVYDSNTDPVHQAELAAQNQQWQDMFLRSPLWNRGGQLNGTATADNPTGIDPNVQNNFAHTNLTTSTNPGAVMNQGGGDRLSNRGPSSGLQNNPPPAPPNPNPNPGAPNLNTSQGPTTVQNQLKSTPALSNTGTANYNPYVAAPGAQASMPNNAVAQAGGSGQGSGGLNIGNPYNSTKPGNPYTFNTKGWNF